jgi:putative nucleotidyltransferase with HDIG domain
MLSVIAKTKRIIDEIAPENEIIPAIEHHSLRVMFFAEILASKAGCLDEDLRVAALLHDIGKLGIAKEILFKKGKLTDLEYLIIQGHSHLGNMILRRNLNMCRAATFVRDHHERWDGRGYPRGLRGDAISIQGRIINICDSFDTMAIDCRSYKKKAMTYNQAFEELRRCSGSQFDSNLVELFIQALIEVNLPEPEILSDADQLALMKYFRL